MGNLQTTEELTAGTTTATTTYRYDTRNLNTDIFQSGAGLAAKHVKFTYDSQGQNTKVERDLGSTNTPTVTTDNTSDPFGRFTRIKQTRGSVTIADSLYGFDNLSRLISETKDGVNRLVSYDKIDQVQTVTGSNAEAYSYDKNGNRTNTGYVTDSYSRLQSDGVYSYIYDAEGNRTKRTNLATNVVDNYAWDYRNRLVSIVTTDAGVTIKSVGYEYDADDQRVRKTVTSASLSAGDGVENYFIDRDQIAFVTDGSGVEAFHYLYGLNVDQVLAQDTPGGMVWSLADRLGSIDLLTDAGGTVVDRRTFDSFGRVLNETNPSISFRYGYTGRERDLESGLDYYRARYYDSNVGRFISVDPMGFDAGDTNLYRYVGNSSTNYTDPSGNFVFVPILLGAIALGGVFGAGYAVADHLEKGGSLNNIDWQDTWEKATIGAFGAAVVTTGAAAIGAGLTTAGVAASTVQAGGLLLGAAGTGWQAGTGIANIQNGKPYTGTLDLIGAGLGVKGLVDGHQGYLQTVARENAAVQSKIARLNNLDSSQLRRVGKILSINLDSIIIICPPTLTFARFCLSSSMILFHST